jgi:hypothetical protein
MQISPPNRGCAVNSERLSQLLEALMKSGVAAGTLPLSPAECGALLCNLQGAAPHEVAPNSAGVFRNGASAFLFLLIRQLDAHGGFSAPPLVDPTPLRQAIASSTKDIAHFLTGASHHHARFVRHASHDPRAHPAQNS